MLSLKTFLKAKERILSKKNMKLDSSTYKFTDKGKLGNIALIVGIVFLPGLLAEQFHVFHVDVVQLQGSCQYRRILVRGVCKAGYMKCLNSKRSRKVVTFHDFVANSRIGV